MYNIKTYIFAFMLSVIALCVSIMSLSPRVPVIIAPAITESVSVAHAAPNYPKPVGHVNDFAGIISGDVEQRLEQKLRDYARKTSIEIAVATIPDLKATQLTSGEKVFSRNGALARKDWIMAY